MEIVFYMLFLIFVFIELLFYVFGRLYLYSGDMTLKWTLQTPFEVMEDVSATLTHRGTTAQSFSNQMEIKYNGQDAKLATTFDMKSTSTDLTVLTVNPWKNFNTALKYNGELVIIAIYKNYCFIHYNSCKRALQIQFATCLSTDILLLLISYFVV